MSTEDFRSKKPQTRDLSRYFDSLADWVKTNIKPLGKSVLIGLEPTSEDANGFAGESFIIEVAHEGAVGKEGAKSSRYLLKRKPTQHLFFPEHDFAAEYLVQEALSNTGIAPVAEFIGYDAGADVLGSPFYIITFVEGRPTPDATSFYHSGWLKESSLETQRAVCTSGLQALAKLHGKTIDELSLFFLKRATNGQAQLDWDLAKWDRFSKVSWFNNEPLPVAQEARQWLEENKPVATDVDNVISWGDARPGNMMYKGAQCHAIIDWDMVSAGDPEKDLGYWLNFDRSSQCLAEQLGDANLPGWPSRKEMVSIYEQALGRGVDRKRLRYHRIFAGWQAACMYARFNFMVNGVDHAAYQKHVNEEAFTLAVLREELEFAHMPGDVN